MPDLPAPRAFYRSRLFWLGLPGLVFLLWVWRDSSNHNTEMVWDRGHRLYHAGVEKGAFFLAYYTELEPRKRIVLKPIAAGRSRILYQFPSTMGSAVVYLESGWHFPPGLEKVHSSPFSQREVSGVRIACWLFILGYGVGWSVALGGWQRHKARLMKKSA